MNKVIPDVGNNKSAVSEGGTSVPPSSAGFGRRSLWPLAAVGEAARRNPYLPDPVPGLERRPINQDDPAVAPAVPSVAGGYHAGGGIDYNGFPSELKFVKRIGSAMTRTLARNFLAGTIDAQWRVGGVSLPPDYGLGIGQTMAADAIWPDNPQVMMRNPGIKPQRNAPQTFRYAPGMGIQDVGPGIGDVGTMLVR